MWNLGATLIYLLLHQSESLFPHRSGDHPPGPEALLKQLQLVSGKFERIVENARNMKIALERKVNDSS